jgi:hypothetical protein
MNAARSSQRLHARPTRTTDSFFNTAPHPSQKYYSNKGRTGDSKANKNVANFFNFDIINNFQIGVDASHTLITGNMFTLQHGNLAPDGTFSIGTVVHGTKACQSINKKREEAAASKRARDDDSSSNNGQSLNPKKQLRFETHDADGKSKFLISSHLCKQSNYLCRAISELTFPIALNK